MGIQFIRGLLLKPICNLKLKSWNKNQKTRDPNVLGTLDLSRKPLGKYSLKQAAVRIRLEGEFDITMILEGIYSGQAQWSLTSNEKIHKFNNGGVKQNIQPFSFHCLQEDESHCIFNEHHVYLMQRNMSSKKAHFSIRAPETVIIERFDYDC